MKGKEEKCQRPPPDSEVVRSVCTFLRKKQIMFGLHFPTTRVPGLYRNCFVCVCSILKKTLLKCLFKVLEEIEEDGLNAELDALFGE